MPIGENETKGQYYKRMIADFKMMMEVLEKDAQHLEHKDDQKIAERILENLDD